MLPTVHIIYASASGNTEAVSEHIAERIQLARVPVLISRAERCDAQVLLETDYFLFATSTWEHGVLNPFFKTLYTSMGESNLSGKYAGFVGLGDTRYEPVLFCKGVDDLLERFKDAGGRQLGTTLKINGDPYKHLDGVVGDWARQFILQVKQHVGRE